MKEMLEPGERRNIHLEVLKAKEMAHEIPEEVREGVNNAIKKADLELQNGGKLSWETSRLLKKLYKLIEK